MFKPCQLESYMPTHILAKTVVTEKPAFSHWGIRRQALDAGTQTHYQLVTEMLVCVCVCVCVQFDPSAGCDYFH